MTLPMKHWRKLAMKKSKSSIHTAWSKSTRSSLARLQKPSPRSTWIRSRAEAKPGTLNTGCGRCQILGKTVSRTDRGIFIDGKLISAPKLNSPIGAKATITGRYTKEQAEELAKQLCPTRPLKPLSDQSRDRAWREPAGVEVFFCSSLTMLVKGMKSDLLRLSKLPCR